MDNSIGCEADYNERMTVPKLSESQKRYKILFENHVSINKGTVTIVDKSFEKRILQLRKIGQKEMLTHKNMSVQGFAFSGMSPFELFMYEYKFPETMRDFLFHYILSSEIDYTLIRDGLYLVSDLNESATNGVTEDEHMLYLKKYGEVGENSDRFASMELKLVISHDTTLKQVNDFLKRNWAFVERNQGLWRQSHERDSKTIRPHLNSKRDYRIMELIEQGLNDTQISTQIEKEYKGYAPTYMAIAKIKSRIKKNKNKI